MPIMPDLPDGVTPSGVPQQTLADQIVAQIRAEITAGLRQPGDELPTQAELAERLQCSVEPVKRAYVILDATGWIVSRRGRPAVVADHPPIS